MGDSSASFGYQVATQLAFELDSKIITINHPPHHPHSNHKNNRHPSLLLIQHTQTDLSIQPKQWEHQPQSDRHHIDHHSSIQKIINRIDLRNKPKTKPQIDDLLNALNTLIIINSNQTNNNNNNTTTTIECSTSTILIQITLGTFIILLDSLLDQAFKIRIEIEYWSEIEDDRLRAIGYFIQTLPIRTLDLIRASSIPKQNIRSSSNPTNKLNNNQQQPTHSAFKFSNLSLFFPHLTSTIGSIHDIRNQNTPQIDFISRLSPMFLIKQECRLKRQNLEESYEELIEKIGKLVSEFNQLELQIDSQQENIEIDIDEHHNDRRTRWIRFSNLIFEMIKITSVDSFSSDEQNKSNNKIHLFDQLHLLLSQKLVQQQVDINQLIQLNSRPNLFLRNWPWLISTPILLYSTTKLIISSKSKILKIYQDLIETFNGFLTGWLIKPIEDIIQTLKAGQTNNSNEELRIISKHSLRSELDSLQRMIIDFGHSKLNWSDDEILMISQHIKEGDLTDILKIWEHEIKTPIRSALLGSLIRVLLIQVQKVKVDLSLAMEGIQTILRSQSLTFGAIGIAPSILICFMLFKFVDRFIFGVKVKSKYHQNLKREVRCAIRRIEKCLILISTTESKKQTNNNNNNLIIKTHERNPFKTIGSLTLDFQIIRNYIHQILNLNVKQNFNIDDDDDLKRMIKNEILMDLQDLQDLNLNWNSKRKLFKRFIRNWKFVFF